MREKNLTPIFNVTNDAELEALAKAYIQAAHKRNLTVNTASSIIAQLWDIEQSTLQQIESLQIQEDEKEKIFREKTKKFISHFPEFVPFYDSPVTEKEIHFNTEFAIEIICGIHKMLLEKKDMRLAELLNYLYEYLKQVSNNSDYYNKARIKSFKEYIFEAIPCIHLKTSHSIGTGSYYRFRTDTSVLPVLYYRFGNNKFPTKMTSINSAAEPYEIMQKYDVKPTATLKKSVQLVWVIETFF